MAPIKKTQIGPQAPTMPATQPVHIPPAKLPIPGPGMSSGGGGTTSSPPPRDAGTKKLA